MKIFSQLKLLSKHLETFEGSWALCDGVVASIYRKSPRFTNDIDIALVDQGDLPARQIAERVLCEMGYEPMVGFVPHPAGGSDQCHGLICCRINEPESFVGIDFLLPVFPWIPKAVLRAQANQVDYGFARLPTITVEDLILAKINALASPQERIQDLDDVQSILSERREIDADYIFKESSAMQMSIPDSIRQAIERISHPTGTFTS
ncbi:nucleotidyl transferase AbiEii/AbiGii toxin family protein [Oligoflexia bacterium]|nr:nucleotidyl transferase AbiEii/AbiGii toxin family protein [Oligoflexia bacterium]